MLLLVRPVAAGVTSLCSSERSRGGTDGGLHCCSLLACFLVEEIREGRGPLACWLAVGVEEQREMEKWRMVLRLELLLVVLGMGEGRGTVGLHLSGEQGAGEREQQLLLASRGGGKTITEGRERPEMQLLCVHEYAVHERDM